MLITTLSSPGRSKSYWIRILGNSIPLMNWSHPDNGMKRPVASLGCCLSPRCLRVLASPGLGIHPVLSHCQLHSSCFWQTLSSIFTWPRVATGVAREFACSASPCLWIGCNCFISPCCQCPQGLQLLSDVSWATTTVTRRTQAVLLGSQLLGGSEPLRLSIVIPSNPPLDDRAYGPCLTTHLRRQLSSLRGLVEWQFWLGTSGVGLEATHF